MPRNNQQNQNLNNDYQGENIVSNSGASIAKNNNKGKEKLTESSEKLELIKNKIGQIELSKISKKKIEEKIEREIKDFRWEDYATDQQKSQVTMNILAGAFPGLSMLANSANKDHWKEWGEKAVRERGKELVQNLVDRATQQWKLEKNELIQGLEMIKKTTEAEQAEKDKEIWKKEQEIIQLENKLDEKKQAEQEAKQREQEAKKRNKKLFETKSQIPSVDYVNLTELREKYRNLEKSAKTNQEELKVKNDKLAEYINASEKLEKSLEAERNEYQRLLAIWQNDQIIIESNERERANLQIEVNDRDKKLETKQIEIDTAEYERNQAREEINKKILEIRDKNNEIINLKAEISDLTDEKREFNDKLAEKEKEAKEKITSNEKEQENILRKINQQFWFNSPNLKEAVDRLIDRNKNLKQYEPTFIHTIGDYTGINWVAGKIGMTFTAIGAFSVGSVVIPLLIKAFLAYQTGGTTLVLEKLSKTEKTKKKLKKQVEQEEKEEPIFEIQSEEPENKPKLPKKAKVLRSNTKVIPKSKTK